MNLQEAMISILAGMYANSDYTTIPADEKISAAYDVVRKVMNFERMQEEKRDVKPFIG